MIRGQSTRNVYNHKPYCSLLPHLTIQRLDRVRDDAGSWKLAIALASQRNAFPDPVRHFGVSVLESGIKYHWGTYSDTETHAIRHGLLQLCGEVLIFLYHVDMAVGWYTDCANLFDFKTCVALRQPFETNLACILGRPITNLTGTLQSLSRLEGSRVTGFTIHYRRLLPFAGRTNAS